MWTMSCPEWVCASAAHLAGSWRAVMVSTRMVTPACLLNSSACWRRFSSEAGTKWFQASIVSSRFCANAGARPPVSHARPTPAPIEEVWTNWRRLTRALMASSFPLQERKADDAEVSFTYSDGRALSSLARVVCPSGLPEAPPSTDPIEQYLLNQLCLPTDKLPIGLPRNAPCRHGRNGALPVLEPDLHGVSPDGQSARLMRSPYEPPTFAL